MKRKNSFNWFWFACVAVSLGLLSLIGSSCNKKTAVTQELNLAIWSNYITDDLIKRFEAKENVRVVISNYSSNEELLAKLQAGGSVYDVIVPSDYMVTIMSKLGLIQRLDGLAIPNQANVDPRFSNLSFDKGNSYSMPYAWSTTGILVNRKYYKGAMAGWADFFGSEELNGKISMLDDVREVMAAALKAKGHSLNSTTVGDIDDAKELLKKVRSRVKMFTSEPIPAITSGEVSVAQMYSSDALQAQKRAGGELEYVIPREGATMAVDNLAIPQAAKNVSAAHKFINFMLEEESNQKLVESILAGPVLKATRMRLPETLQKNTALFPDTAVASGLETIADIGDATQVYDRVWTELKVGE